MAEALIGEGVGAVAVKAGGVVIKTIAELRVFSKTSISEFIPAANISLQQINKLDGVFETMGLTNVNPLTIPDGIKMIRALEQAGLSTKDALSKAKDFISTGSTLPIATPIDITDKLVKVVPAGGSPSLTTGYWMTESEFNVLKANPAMMADKLGLPPGMQVNQFDVFQIKPLQNAVVYQSKVAPTTVNSVANTSGGATQTIVLDRNLFTTPVKTGSIKIK